MSYVRNGGGLFIAAAPEVEPGVIAAMFGWDAAAFTVDPAPRQLSLAATDVRHPLLRPFGALAANLGQINFHQAWRVRPDQWQVPAQFSDGSPAVLDRAEGAGRVVLFASDVDRQWNDFPLHPAFVPFAVEAVRYLSARRGTDAGAARVGRPAWPESRRPAFRSLRTGGLSPSTWIHASRARQS